MIWFDHFVSSNCLILIVHHHLFLLISLILLDMFVGRFKQFANRSFLRSDLFSDQNNTNTNKIDAETTIHIDWSLSKPRFSSSFYWLVCVSFAFFYGFCGCWSFEESENRHILRLTFFNWATVFRPFRHVHFQKDEWGGGGNQQTKIFKIVLLIWELKFYIKKPQKPHRFSDFGSQMHSNLIWSVVNWIPIRYIGIPKFPLFNGHLLLGDCLKSS